MGHPIWRHRIDMLWIEWELGLLEDDSWPPYEVSHANGY